MTATIRNYTNLELHGSIIYALELDDFPTNAQRNEQVLIKGVLWIYSMVGGVLTWFPLNNQKNTYVHTQAVPSLTWTVNHNLGSEDFVLGLYDETNSLMSPAFISNVTNSGFVLNFTEEVSGRAVAIFQTELFAPQVTAQSIVADSVIIGGVVTANNAGLSVNGNTVQVLNSLGQADYGTL